MNPGQQVVQNLFAFTQARDNFIPGQFYPGTVLYRDILGREFKILARTTTMLSKGTNIVLLCAILTNITVSISSVPAISIFFVVFTTAGAFGAHDFIPGYMLRACHSGLSSCPWTIENYM